MQRPSRPRRSIATVAVAWLVVLAAGTALAPVTAATSTGYVANCDVKLRATPSTTANVYAIIPTGTVVLADQTVTGDSWSATCGTNVSGSTWLAVTTVSGTSVSSLYGVSHVYVASGLLSVQVTVVHDWLEGIDVSQWQGSIDYKQVAAAGKRFVIAKATEGIGYTDPTWATNLAHATAAGLKVSGYHFARPDGNPTKPVQEADWFVSQLALAPGMVVPALDLERSGGMSPSALQAWVGAWLSEVYAKTGVRPMIYTSPSFWRNALNNTTVFADQGYTVLWIAHWFVTQPSVPANNWSGHGWTFWQYDDCGKVPGISGCVDMDRFNGLDLTPVTVGADFQVGATPVQQPVEQGASTQFSIPITRSYFTLPIKLQVSGLPANVVASLDPATTSGAIATLSINAVSGASVPAAGTYPLVVTGTADGLTRTTTANLVITDAAPPTVAGPVTRLYAHATLSTSAPLRTTWSAKDASGVTSYALQRLVNGVWSPVALASPTTTSITENLATGATFAYRVQATDGASNTSSWVAGPTITPIVTQQWSARVTYGGTWHAALATWASGGSVKYAFGQGAWARFAFTGSSVAWVAATGPNRGSADVYIDGVYKQTISLYSTTFQARQIVYAYNWATNGAHWIKIFCRGTAGHPRIDIDAFLTLVQG